MKENSLNSTKAYLFRRKKMLLEKTTSLNFNGISDCVEVPDADNLSITENGISISAWIRPDVLNFLTTSDGGGDGEYIEFLGKGNYPGDPDGNQVEYLFRLYNKTSPTRPNRLSFYVFNKTGGIGVGSYFQDTLTVGGWIHIIGAIDSTKTYLYKNGVLRDSDVYTATITPENTKAPFRIGTVFGATSGDPSYFKGAIKDVIIFNKKLSDAEALALATQDVVPSGAVARFLCNDYMPGLTDSIGGNDGVIQGATYSMQ